MSGRKNNLNLILRQFTTTEKDSKIIYQCKHCTLVYTVKNITKMTKHILQKCTECPVELKTMLNTKIISNNPSGATTHIFPEILQSNESLSLQSTISSSSAISPARTSTTFPVLPLLSVSPQLQSRGSMNYFNQMDMSENKKANCLLAKAIFSSGTPLSIVENQHWKEFLNYLQPSYDLPTRNELSTTLLDSHYSEAKEDVEKTMTMSENVSLQLDGWSNIRSEGIINFTIMTSDQKHFYIKSLETKNNCLTSDYITNEIVKVINQYNSKKFLAVITDNTTNMRKATTTMNEMFPHMSTIGCLTHTLHLIITDLIKLPIIKDIIDKIKDIIKCIHNSPLLGCSFDSIKKSKNCTKSLVLPASTRSGSYLFTLETMLACKTCLQTLAANEDAINILGQERKKLILDDQIFWPRIEVIKRLLEPMVFWILKLESSQDTLHLSCRTFNEIEKSFEDNFPLSLIKIKEKKVFMEKFSTRKEYALKSIHKAACLLDPKAQGCYLTQEEQLDAIEYIINFVKSPTDNKNLLVEIAQYRAHEGIWSKQFIWDCAKNKNMSPSVWWKGIIGQNSELSNIAVKILSVPATSISTTESSSTFSTKKQNNLSTDRAIKLNYIAYYWRTKLNTLKPNFSSLDNDDLIYSDCNQTQTIAMETSESQVFENQLTNKLSEYEEVLSYSDRPF